MTRRFSPFWWPVFALTGPVLIPFLGIRHAIFTKGKRKADEINQARLTKAENLDLPELEWIEVTPLVEWKTGDGFQSAPGISYLFRTDRGSLLFDVGFGPERGALALNALRLGFSWDRVDALVISHLHMDHMGGERAVREHRIRVPPELGDPSGMECYMPDRADAPGFTVRRVTRPGLLPAGLGTTGPLARNLFLMGWCEEQIVLGRLKGKGLMVFTGCGHPGIGLILEMISRLSPEPLYALGGGLHYPVTASRLKKPGLEAVMVFGTGKPPWKRITDHDLTLGINRINEADPRNVFLSAHDTCDHAIARFQRELKAKTRILRAGNTYRL